MGKDKIRRFALTKEFSHFFEPTLGEEYEGKGRRKVEGLFWQ